MCGRKSSIPRVAARAATSTRASESPLAAVALRGPDSLRASDAERARHAEILSEHTAEGRLSVEELSERVERAYAARTLGELRALLSDLPSTPSSSERRHGSAHARRELRQHVTSFLLVNLLLVVIWAATGAGYFWPIWPILGWGLGIGSHAWEALGGRPALGGPRGGHRRIERRVA